MTVLLTVLKVIGVLLLLLLCLVFLLVLLVLFVPIRYRADGAYQEKLTAKAEVTWLLRLVSVRVVFEDGLDYSVRAAGIRLFPRKAAEKGDRAKSAEDASASAADGQGSGGGSAKGEMACSDGDRTSVWKAAGDKASVSAGRESSENGHTSESGHGKAAAESGQEPAENAGPKTAEFAAGDAPRDGSRGGPENGSGKAPENGGQEAAADSGQKTPEDDSAGSEEEPGKKQSLSDKVYDFFRKITDKLTGICDKIENIQGTVSRYVNILKRDETKRLIALVWNQLLKIMKHVLPRKMDICFVIGTGDPASTGQIMALQGMLYPILRERVRIVPDFENKHVEGTFHIKGHITAFCLLLCALRVIVNRNFRQLIRLLRKKEEA